MKSWLNWTGWFRRKAPSQESEANEPVRDAGWSLRFRLALTVLIALTPVAIVSIMQGVDRVQRDVADVRERLSQIAQAASNDEENVLASAEQVLRALSNQPEVRGASAECNGALSDALKGLKFFINIARVDSKGNVLCWALPPSSRNVSRQSWWNEAMRSTRFFISERIHSPRTGRAALAMVLPVWTPQGAFDGVLVMGLDTQWFNFMLREKRLPEGGIVALFDSTGTLIAANNQSTAQTIFAGGVKPSQINRSLVPAKGPQGESWSFALAPLIGNDVFIAFAMRDLDLFSWTYIHVATDLLLPVLMLSLASMAIWIATDRQVSRWVTYLGRMAMAYARGHYSIRPAALEEAPTEFRQLGETFSSMAAAVQDRDRRLRDAIAMKTTLIKETHHRVKNNLQIVMSLLSLQATELRDPIARDALKQAQVRVNALALVHRILHEVEDQSSVDLKRLLHDLGQQIHEGFGGDRRDVRLEFDVVAREASSDLAVPLTLFTVEALTNVFKHAYPTGSAGGAIHVSLRPVGGGQLELAVADEGIGMTEGAAPARGVGSRLTEAFANQVNGTVSWTRQKGGGTIVSLVFPDPQPEASPEEPQQPEARAEPVRGAA
jgi:two-component sensor histidine kinase